VCVVAALIALVVAIFYMSGWQMGAVEAVSLSILVGSSVDYCMHLAEGYLFMGRAMPPHIQSGVRKTCSLLNDVLDYDAERLLWNSSSPQSENHVLSHVFIITKKGRCVAF
jgi:hypothetical protein